MHYRGGSRKHGLGSREVGKGRKEAKAECVIYLVISNCWQVGIRNPGVAEYQLSHGGREQAGMCRSPSHTVTAWGLLSGGLNSLVIPVFCAQMGQDTRGTLRQRDRDLSVISTTY